LTTEIKYTTFKNIQKTAAAVFQERLKLQIQKSLQ